MMCSISGSQLLCKVKSNANKKCYQLIDSEGRSRLSEREQTVGVNSKSSARGAYSLQRNLRELISLDGCFQCLSG